MLKNQKRFAGSFKKSKSVTYWALETEHFTLKLGVDYYSEHLQ